MITLPHMGRDHSASCPPARGCQRRQRIRMITRHDLKGVESRRDLLESRGYKLLAWQIPLAATYPGLVLCCKPIGVLEVMQIKKGKKERNDRIFVVLDRSPCEADLTDIRRLPKRAVKELEQFFLATDALEDKELEFLG